jgi:hypothetical protein
MLFEVDHKPTTLGYCQYTCVSSPCSSTCFGTENYPLVDVDRVARLCVVASVDFLARGFSLRRAFAASTGESDELDALGALLSGWREVS